MQKSFVPQIDAAYYIHLFKSTTQPGMLFRAYPGPWRVLRNLPGGGYECVDEFEQRPLLKDVANKWFAGGTTTTKMRQV